MPVVTLKKKRKDIHEDSRKGKQPKIQKRCFNFLWAEMSEQIEFIYGTIIALVIMNPLNWSLSHLIEIILYHSFDKIKLNNIN